MYTSRSRLSPRKQMDLLRMSVAGAIATATSEIVGDHRNTATSFFMRLRRLIADKLPNYELSGEVEVDESYFGGPRKGKRCRGASVGLLKRGGKVYTAIVPNAKTETLLPIIEEKVTPDSIVYTDLFKAYNALDVSDFHHMRINHSELFADRGNHINGIENFWNQAKRHLRKFSGINKVSFHWFIKECEWRFNGGNYQNLYKHLKHRYLKEKH
jgi:transposase